MSDTLRFYFDYVSPYAFLAWQRVPALAREYGLKLEPVPVLLGGLLKAHNNIGPAEIPSKRAWVYADSLRTAALDGVYLSFPPEHPFNPLLALRLTHWVAREAPEHLEDLISDCFAAAWQAAQVITDPRTLAGILSHHGMSYRDEDVQSPEIKAALRSATEEAATAGVFGVPTFQLGDTLLWGHDRLGQLESILKDGDPLDRELLAEALAVPSVTRSL